MGLISSTKRSVIEAEANYKLGKKDYKGALKKYLLLLEMSIRNQWLTKQAIYHKRCGDCYEKLDHKKLEDIHKDHEKAGEHYVKAADIYRNLGDHAKAGEIFERGAYSFEEIGRYSDAAEFYMKSALMFVDIGDYFNASYMYQSASKFYEQAKEFYKAGETYLKTAALSLKVKDKGTASDSFKRAAKTFEKQEKWDEAIDAYADSVELDSMMHKYLDMADNYENIAFCYEKLENKKDSLYYHTKSAELREKGGDRLNAAASYINSGTLYESFKDLENAKEMYERAEKIFRREEKYGQLGKVQKSIARVYEHLGDLFSAAGYHQQSAESFLSDNNNRESSTQFLAAANSYKAYAEKQFERGFLELSAEAHMNVGFCYEKVKDFMKAAEQYLKYAEIATDLDTLNERIGYKKAAMMYANAGMLWEAGIALQSNKNYKDGADIFIKYAKSKDLLKDLIESGKGYLQTGQCYKRLDDEVNKKVNFDKAASRFSKYVNEITNKDKLEGDELLRFADAYRYLGESSLGLNDTRSAENHFSKSTDTYIKAGDDRLAKLTRAFLDEVGAQKAIDHGYYEDATTLLENANKSFKELYDEKWTVEYKLILKEHAEFCNDLLRKIELKPDLSLTVDQRSFTFPNIPLILNVVVENHGAHALQEISFLEHLPDDIKLMRLPATIERMEPGDLVKVTIELNPQKGGYFRLQPIEVYFEDEEENKYVKSCNEVSVEVVNRPEADYTHYTNAVEIYSKYGENQSLNKNFFQAGDGYKEAAIVYGKFNSDSRLGDLYLKSVENYIKYTEEKKDDINTTDPVKIKRLADAFWGSAECNRLADRQQHSRENYLKASEIYKIAGEENRAVLAKSFNLIVDGKILASQGRYQESREKLDLGLKELDEAIKEGGFSDEYIKQLEQFEDEARLVLRQISEKPQISIEVTQPDSFSVNELAEFKLVIENPLKIDIVDVKPVLKTIDGFDVIKKPDYFNLIKVGEKIETSFILMPLKKGVFEFKPLDILYNSQDGKSFSQGSPRMNLTISEEMEGTKVEDYSYKPEVVLNVDRRSVTFKDLSVLLNAKLENKSKIPLTQIMFITNLEEGLDVGELPEKIQKMEPGEVIETSFEIFPELEGDYHMKPLEVFYLDPAGKKYVTTSNEVQIKVMSKPSEEYEYHSKAVDDYINYADNQQENGNYFLAAGGYREAARVHGKFNSDDVFKKHLRKSISLYQKYITENTGKKSSKSALRRISESFWWKGIAESQLKNYSDAEKSFTESIKYFEMIKDEKWITIVKAFKFKVSGKNLIETGEMENAKTALEESQQYLETTLSSGILDEALRDNVEKSLEEVRMQLSKARGKPQLKVSASSPKTTNQDVEFDVKIEIKNTSGEDANSVKIHPNIPEGISIVRQPKDIELIKDGETKEVILSLKGFKPGLKNFKPVDLTYKQDEVGQKIGCNTIEVEISETDGKILETPEKSTKIEDKTPEINSIENLDGKTDENVDDVFIEIEDIESIPINEKSIISAKIINNSPETIVGVRIIANMPREFNVIGVNPTEFDEIKSKSQKQVELLFQIEEEGRYKTPIFELFYKDLKGNRYFGSPNEIEITVGSGGDIFEYGRTYLIEGDKVLEKRPKISENIGENKLCAITGENPNNIKDYPENSEYIWLTRVESEFSVEPTDLNNLSLKVSQIIQNTQNIVVFIEDINYLIEHNEFDIVLEVINYLKDLVSKNQAILILGFDEGRVDEIQSKKILSEGQLIQ